jgi:hypothetical protein
MFGKRKKLWLEDPKCHYCKSELLLSEATLDHKIPKKLGGTDTLDNLVLACKYCNGLKGCIPYEDFINGIRMFDLISARQQTTIVSDNRINSPMYWDH